MKRPLHELIVLADSLNNQVQKPKKAKEITDPPKADSDKTWQKRVDDKHKGKARNPATTTEPGVFTQSPSKIAHDLKEKSHDYNGAQKKLNMFINRKGRDLQGADKSRLYQAKDDLKHDYGIPTTSTVEQPFYAVPPIHNLDDKVWPLDEIVPDNREKNLIPDLASVQNSEQNPGQTMSSVKGPSQDYEPGRVKDLPLFEPTPIDTAGAQLKDALAALAPFENLQPCATQQTKPKT